ncbi:hypothetical protein DFH09DRAFT_1313093 [Mycena vulgaris]|nr:hypothetical protein DFH09DRAFT_1313093 [Mycena vulgaris]
MSTPATPPHRPCASCTLPKSSPGSTTPPRPSLLPPYTHPRPPPPPALLLLDCPSSLAPQSHSRAAIPPFTLRRTPVETSQPRPSTTHLAHLRRRIPLPPLWSAKSPIGARGLTGATRSISGLPAAVVPETSIEKAEVPASARHCV